MMVHYMSISFHHLGRALGWVSLAVYGFGYSRFAVFFILAMMPALSGGLHAQTTLRLERQVIGGMATSSTGSSGLQLTATLGETMTPTLGTSTLRIAQGFHQVSSCVWSGDILASSPKLDCLHPLLVLQDAYANVGATRVWRDAAGNFLGNGPTISISAPGTYILDLSLGQCALSDTVVIIEDKALPKLPLLIGDTITCQDSLAQLRVAGTPGMDNWVWQDPTGQLLAWDSLVEVSIPGRYTLRVTGTNGCSDTIGVAVALADDLPIVSVIKEGDLDCIRDSVRIEAIASNPGYSYQWTGPLGKSSSVPDFFTTVPGIWQVVVRDTSTGCTTTRSVAVDLDTLSPQVMLTEGDTITCREPQISLMAQVVGTGPYLFQWTAPDSILQSTAGPMLQITQAGTWNLRVMDTSNSCEGVTTVRVYENITTPTAEAGHEEVECLDQTGILWGASSDPADSLLWLNAMGQRLGAGPNYTANSSGTYILQVVDVQGCTARATVTLNLTNIDNLPTIFTPNGDGVNDLLDLQPCSDEEEYLEVSLIVFNRWGAEVFRASDYRHDWGGTHRGKLLPTGQYYYVAQIAGKEYRMPLTIVY